MTAFFLSENGLGAILIVNIVVAISLGSDAPLKALQESAGGRGEGAGRRLLYTPPFPLPPFLPPFYTSPPSSNIQMAGFTLQYVSRTMLPFLFCSFLFCLFPLPVLETNWTKFQGVN